MRKVLRLFLLIAFATSAFPENLTYVRIDQPVVESRLKLTPVDQAARLTMLRNQFVKAGCIADHITEQPVSGQSEPNLICTIPGTEPGSIVIAARSDFTSKRDEAKVDWATLTMLPLLAESLYGAVHRYSLVFVAFSGHGNLSGSETYLKALSEQERKSIRAMIDLEQLGRTPPTYAFATVQSESGISHIGYRPVANTISHEDTLMSRLLPVAANTLKLSEAPEQNSEQLVTDAQNFERAGALALTITSPAYAKIVRSGNTEVSMARTELDPKVYYQTYNLLCVYTLYLDRGIAPPRSKPSTEVAGSTSPATRNATSATPEPAVTLAASSAAQTAPTAVPPTALATANTSAGATPAAPSARQNVDPSAPTFRSTTRLVQVDVVVTDKAGTPLTGLKASDFTVFQDGKSQPVRAFEAHVPLTSESSTNGHRASTMPPNTYSNLPIETQDQSWTIVLYDILNTPTQNQQNARQQLIKLLKSLPSGKPVALFLLAQRLEMLRGFSTDPNNLVAAAEKLNPTTSELLTTEGERESTIGHTAYAAAMSTPGQVGQNATSLKAGNVQRQLQGYYDMETLRARQRILFTLDAMKAMARSVSGYPGRKNLIWLSGSFPIRIEPSQAALDPFRSVESYFGKRNRDQHSIN